MKQTYLVFISTQKLKVLFQKKLKLLITVNQLSCLVKSKTFNEKKIYIQNNNCNKN